MRRGIKIGLCVTLDNPLHTIPVLRGSRHLCTPSDRFTGSAATPDLRARLLNDHPRVFICQVDLYHTRLWWQDHSCRRRIRAKANLKFEYGAVLQRHIANPY